MRHDFILPFHSVSLTDANRILREATSLGPLTAERSETEFHRNYSTFDSYFYKGRLFFRLSRPAESLPFFNDAAT